MSGSLVVALMLTAAAFAAEVSRDEYKEAAEPICKTSAKANEQILAGVRKEVKQGKLKTAAAKFAKASKEQSRTLKKLEALPQPAADKARLGKWLGYLEIEAELFEQAGNKLKAGDKPGAEHVFAKLTPNANKANNQVLPFEFHYCRLEPQKFS
ncbi:MAG TPA: hypothetical protein VN522_03415 [Solirubrobacterales bacterium]|nr:hypothetical protein [Solirubrobacterales bacterium]